MTTLAPSQLQQIATIAKERWGLAITERKHALVENRITKFLFRAPFDTPEEYLDHLANKASEEDMLLFFDLLSTNTTSFYREIEHFHYLEREFYTALARGNTTRPERKIRMWSAACSNGAEPYTMAMHAIDHLPNIGTWDFKILATDLSNTVLKNAREGVYPEKMVEDLDKKTVEKHFRRGKDDNQGKVMVSKQVREMVTINRLNLMEKWPIRGPLDVILCRNVMIYFDRETREHLVNRLYDLLHPGGILIIGSAETLSGQDTKFQTVQPSVYQK